jgi:hypothetical protein
MRPAGNEADAEFLANEMYHLPNVLVHIIRNTGFEGHTP